MFLFSLFVCVFLMLLITGMMFPHINILKSAVVSVSLFFCLYTVVSSMFFLADNFRMLYVMLVCGLILSGILLFLFLVKKKRPVYDFDIRQVILPMLVCIAAVPFVTLKNQYFGMGQDQGVYQTVAVNYCYGITDREQTIDEYSILPDEDARACREIAEEYFGGYDLDYTLYVDTDKDESVLPGMYHGIPVFASMLALWAKISGIPGMLGIQTVFYVCSIMLVMFACSNMKLKGYAQVIAGLVTAFCSVVIWVTKSALTEPFQMLLFSLFIYFITDNDNKNRRWFSVFPVIAFSFFHVCIFTIVSVYLVIYICRYIFEKEKQFIYCSFITVAAYIAGYFTMFIQQPQYTMKNYRDIYERLNFLSEDNMRAVILLTCIVVFIVLASFFSVYEKTAKSDDLLKKINEKNIYKIAVIIVLVLPVIYMAVKMFMKSYTFDDVRNTSIAGFTMTTGAFILPFAMITVIIKTDIVTKDTDRLTVFTLFAYCVLFYSAFLRPDIKFYYYYSRYLAPFIPVLAVFTALAADRCRWFVSVPVAAASMACIMPFNIYLKNNMDDTRTEWSLEEDYSQVISEGDCVIIDEDMLQTSYFTVRNMNRAAVFPVYRELTEEIEFLEDHYNNIYYLTDDEIIDYPDGYDVVYSNILYRSEDDLNNVGEIFPMSTEFYSDTRKVRILYMNTDKK